MKTGPLAVIIVVVILLGSAAYYFFTKTPTTLPAQNTATITGTTTSGTNGVIAGGPLKLEMTTGVSMNYYADTYGLATNPDQVTVKAYIPPCDQGFDYCLYRVATDYANTNFESAGIAIKYRTDLTNKQSCLTTQPTGYTNLHATTTDQNTYATSVIGPLSDAGAGHYANGNEYRLWTGASCTQFDTRIGATQFANYPAGTKTEFARADQLSVEAELKSLLYDVQLHGTRIVFPGV